LLITVAKNLISSSVCFCLKRLLYLVRDFSTVVSELRFWPRFLIKGGRGAVWYTDQNQRPLKRVEFICGEMLLDLRFATCVWRKCSTAYKYVLVVAYGGLRWLVMLDQHGEGVARDLQWWCFAWQMRCFVNSGCCVVVLW